MKLDRRLLRLALADRAAFSAAIAFGFAGGILTIGQARLLAGVMNAVFLQGIGLAGVRGALGILIGIIILRAGAAWAAEVVAHRVAAQAKQTLRARLLEHLFALGPIPLTPAPLSHSEGEEQGVRAETGELTNLLTEGIEALDAWFSQFLPQVFLAALIPLAILIFVFPLDPLSGLILLLTGPLIPLFMALIGSQADAQTRKQWQSLSRLSARFLDALQGLTTLKLLGRSRIYAETLDQAGEDYRQKTMVVLRVSFLSALTLELLSTLSTAVVAVQIGLRLLYGYLTFEQAFFVLLLTPEFYLPLRLLGQRFHAGMAGAEVGDRAFQALEAQPVDRRPLTDNGGLPAVPGQPSKIAFEHVSFTYPGAADALRDASFTLDPGTLTALVGRSGAGKSTIAALLLGFIRPTSGAITLAANPYSLSSIAYVPQRPYLFADTVAANLRLARPDASDEEVAAAACLAHADEFIRQLPQGYDTLIGERGMRLSGGQAQRIAIARAFLQDAPMLILDEPAAYLDPATEGLLADSLERLSQGRTVLVIAHRLQTIARADRVIRLEKGQVVEIRTNDPRRRTDDRRSMPEDGQPSVANRHLSPGVNLTPIPYPLASTPLRLISSFIFHPSSLSRVALSVVLGFAAIAAGMGLMSTSVYIIAAAAVVAATAQPSVAVLQVAIVGVRFFGLSRGVFRYLERLTTHDVTFRVLTRLRGWFYRAVEPLAPLTHFHSGDLLARAIGEINSLENFYVRGVAPTLVAILVSLGSATFLVGFSLHLAAALLGCLTLGGIVLPVVIRLLSRVPGQSLVASRARLNVALVDLIQGMADLLALRAAPRQRFRVEAISQEVAAAQWALAVLNGLQSALGMLFANGGMIAVVVLAIPLVNAGLIDGVLLPVLALWALTSFEAVQPLPLAAQHLESNMQIARRLFTLAIQPPQVCEPAESEPVPNAFDLRVADLSFTYPDGTHSLQNVSFSLPPATHIALVGASGAGKTTLLNLLLRLWEYDRQRLTDDERWTASGRTTVTHHSSPIILNDLPLSSYSPSALRRAIAVVPQNVYLFSATVRENLTLARPDATQEQIEQAARAACIHDFIQSLPQGYDTWVGEHGLRLSGGERQRLAIARAILKDAALTIFDEPTAYLDADTEQLVLASLQNRLNRCSTLWATHRLAGMEWMDEILVIEAGRIVERGTHAGLLAQASLYRRMWGLQNEAIY